MQALTILATLLSLAAPQLQPLTAGPYLLALPEGQVHVRWTVTDKQCGQVFWESETGSAQLDGIMIEPPDGKYKTTDTVCGADFKELRPCARYRYRVGPGKAAGNHEFRAPPAAGAACADGMRVLVYGDTRTNHSRHALVAGHMQKAGAHLLLNIGDLVNYSNKLEEWYKFFEIERDLLPTAPLALAPGNHEAWPDFAMGLAMMKRFFRAGRTGGAGTWSFDWGPAHILIIDLYMDGPLEDSDIDSIEKDLTGVPEGRFKFALLHEPPYSFGRHKPREPMVKLRPVFKKTGVHAVFAGHSHHYEHFNVDGIHYLTVGGAGAPFHSPRQNVVPEQEKYFVKAARVHHFLTVDLHPAKASCTVHDVDNHRVLDSWEIPL